MARRLAIILAAYRRAGYLSAADYAAYRPLPYRAARQIHRLRARHAWGGFEDLLFVLRTTSRMMNRYRVHALALVLRANTTHYARRNRRPATKASRTFSFSHMPPLAFRYRPRFGWQFHPSAALQSILIARESLEDTTFVAQMREFDRYVVPHGARRLPAPEYYFPYLGQRPGWTSPLPQVRLVDAYTHLYLLTLETRYLTKASRVLSLLIAPLSSGGMCITQPDGSAWFPMYLAVPECKILNPQLTAALCLADVAAVAPSETLRATAEASFDAARHAIRDALPAFDTGTWSRYGLRGHDARIDYYRYHIRALIWLLRFAPDAEVFRLYAWRWAVYDSSPLRVTLRARSPYVFSPNGDGVRDRASFDCTTTKPGYLYATLRRSRTVIRFPHTIGWADTGGEIVLLPRIYGRRRVPDGRYTLTVRLVTLPGDRTYPSAIATSRVWIDLTRPRSPALRQHASRSGRTLSFVTADAGSGPVRWVVRIIRRRHAVTRRASPHLGHRRRGVVFFTIGYLRRLAGRHRAPLRAVVTVTDVAGNTARSALIIRVP